MKRGIKFKQESPKTVNTRYKSTITKSMENYCSNTLEDVASIDKNESKVRNIENKVNLSKFVKITKPQINKASTSIDMLDSDSVKINQDNSQGNKRSHLKVQCDEVATKIKRDNTNEKKLLADGGKNHPKLEENWYEMLKNLREMRKNSDAPVDSMGCQRCMDENADPKVL